MEVKICQHCGADNRVEVTKCWICHADVRNAPSVVLADLAESEVPKIGPSDTFFATLSALLGVMLLIVGIGAAVQDPGLGVFFAIIVVPALAATLIRLQARQARGEYVSWGSRLLTFMLSAAVTFAILIALAIAAAVAFVVYCFFALGSR